MEQFHVRISRVYQVRHRGEDLVVVNTENASNHLGNDDYVPQVTLKALRLLHMLIFLLCSWPFRGA